MRFGQAFLFVQSLVLVNVARAAFSLTESGNSLIADTNAGLVFTVDKTNGDITSMKFNGIEVQDQGSKKSHIGSGIGASCSWTRTGNENNYFKITCTAGSLTQYVHCIESEHALMAPADTMWRGTTTLRFIWLLSECHASSNESLPLIFRALVSQQSHQSESCDSLHASAELLFRMVT